MTKYDPHHRWPVWPGWAWVLLAVALLIVFIVVTR
jgi:hypothetical protein